MKKLEKSESAITTSQSAAEKRRIKAQAIASKFKGGSEPSTDPLDYQFSMVKVLNWYNLNTDQKKIRSYLNEYLISTNQKKLVSILNRASDHEIRSLGLLARLKSRGQYLDTTHETYITNRIQVLVTLYDTSREVAEESTPKVKIDKTKELSILYGGTFDGAIDDFVTNKKSDFNASAFLKTNEVSAPVAKEIGAYYKSMLNELVAAQSDLEEGGYGKWKKPQFKKFIEFVQSIVDACLQQIVSGKVRKPRKQRIVPPTKLVSKMKFSKEDTTLNLKSIKPESIIGSGELWVYNTKYRKLSVYKSESGGKLSVKGSTILGFDVKESIQVMIRKPEEFFRNTQLAKRALYTAMKTITTRPVTPTGRINEDTVLLGAF